MFAAFRPPGRSDLTSLDQEILKLCTPAAGTPSSTIRSELSIIRGGAYSFTAIYSSIDRLERLRYLGSRLAPEDNTGPGCRHKPRLLLYTTGSGFLALRRAQRVDQERSDYFKNATIVWLSFAMTALIVVSIAKWTHLL